MNNINQPNEKQQVSNEGAELIGDTKVPTMFMAVNGAIGGAIVTPLVGATVSAITGNEHHVMKDIVGGAIVGTASGIISGVCCKNISTQLGTNSLLNLAGGAGVIWYNRRDKGESDLLVEDNL